MKNVIEITTKSGFSCEIDREALDDWNFARAAMKAAEGGKDALNLAMYMADHMISKKDSKRLEKHVATKDGRIPTTRMMEEINEIFTALKEVKKSESSPE